MMIRITELKEQHLEDAAKLVAERYKLLLSQIPELPTQYSEPSTLLPLLGEIWKASEVGAAAFSGGKLVGFITGWQMGSFRGKKSTYSPEWANAAVVDDNSRIYEEMYRHLSARWLANGYIAHYISLFPNDPSALNTWHWLGFGMVAVDALRSLEPIHTMNNEVDVRRATSTDLEEVLSMHNALWQYHIEAPIFLLQDQVKQAELADWLEDPQKTIWLAEQNREPIAFFRIGPAAPDVCMIIQDPETVSIYAAYTKEIARRQGAGEVLLSQALKSAAEDGCKRCAVSFEPMNAVGTRFWSKYFKPVVLSVYRCIDDRLVSG